MYKNCYQDIQIIHYMNAPKGWADISGDEPLGFWCMTQEYNVHKMVQQVCKILQRLNRPQTVKEFLAINPADYMGLYGISEKRHLLLLNLRKQFLQIHMHLDDNYATD